LVWDVRIARVARVSSPIRERRKLQDVIGVKNADLVPILLMMRGAESNQASLAVVVDEPTSPGWLAS
jgi:hypothetical protein